MKHSFVTPRPKRIISGELKLVLFFFSVTIMMLVGTYLFLGYKTYDYLRERHANTQKERELGHAIDEVRLRIREIEAEVKIAERITTDNTVMKESIRNLFDLVPDTITLSRAELESDALILYGITPNKDTYEYLLHAPLKSIFHRTYTSFHPVENGWYRFVSSNFLDDENATAKGTE